MNNYFFKPVYLNIMIQMILITKTVPQDPAEIAAICPVSQWGAQFFAAFQ